MYVCVCECVLHANTYLQIVSILQGEALSHQPDAFACLGGDAVDALVAVVVVGREVWREQDALCSNWGGPTLRWREEGQTRGGARTKSVQLDLIISKQETVSSQKNNNKTTL